jgi:hypothetical protein
MRVIDLEGCEAAVRIIRDRKSGEERSLLWEVVEAAGCQIVVCWENSVDKLPQEGARSDWLGGHRDR